MYTVVEHGGNCKRFCFFWDDSGGDLAAVMQAGGRCFGSGPGQWGKQLLADRDRGLHKS